MQFALGAPVAITQHLELGGWRQAVAGEEDSEGLGDRGVGALGFRRVCGLA
ncbi:hypothetical protein [Streptomyces flaveolus]|uniref:hypothetical protein n=1 Tax=Streptomyces flaveolus TaxID=67297 RepID=UPI0033C95BF3